MTLSETGLSYLALSIVTLDDYFINIISASTNRNLSRPDL
jgi:hypothetical protein